MTKINISYIFKDSTGEAIPLPPEIELYLIERGITTCYIKSDENPVVLGNGLSSIQQTFNLH